MFKIAACIYDIFKGYKNEDVNRVSNARKKLSSELMKKQNRRNGER